MFDFLKIDDDFWDFPFYRGKPAMPKFGWLILAVVVFVEMIMIFGLIDLIPIPLYSLPKEIVAILPCIIFLLALAYACRGKLGLFFKVPTFNDVKIIIIFYILSSIYAFAMIFVLEFLGIPMAKNSAEAALHSIFPFITDIIIKLIALLEEELFKVSLLLILMAVIYYFTKDKKISVWVGVFLNLIIFGLCHLSAYNGNIIQCILVIGLGSFFDLFVYLKTKNIVNSWIVHVMYDYLFTAVGFLLGLQLL